MRSVRIPQIILAMLITLAFYNAFAEEAMSPQEAKQLVKTAVAYALENKDPNMDYSKYVAKDFINPIDGNIFNYTQWVNHQKDLKKMLKSMHPVFDEMVAEGNHVAAIFRVQIVKNDGSLLEVKDYGFFTISHHKIVKVEELTRLISGNAQDKNIGSTK